MNENASSDCGQLWKHAFTLSMAHPDLLPGGSSPQLELIRAAASICASLSTNEQTTPQQH